MKPIMFLESDAFDAMTRDKGKEEQDKIEAQGYVVVFLRPGAKAVAIFPPPETNGHRKPKRRSR